MFPLVHPLHIKGENSFIVKENSIFCVTIGEEGGPDESKGET